MEALDVASRQSIGLPSISHLDAEKIKREEMDYQRKHSAPAMVSPLHPFPGPSPSWGNHQSLSASAVSGPLGGLLSPPESRRTSGDEKEQSRPAARQSLPSIHEALGSEQPLSYPGPPPPAPASSSQSLLPPSTTTSPSDTRSRNFSVDHINNPGPPNPFSHPRSPYMSTSASAAPPPPPPPAQPDTLRRPSFSSTQHNPRLPTLHPLRTTQSPPPSVSRPTPPYSSYQPPQPSSAYENPGSQSAGPMNSQYGYSQYPSNYPLSAPPPSGPNSGYPPSTAAYSAPARYPPPSWRDGDLRNLEEKKLSRPSLAPYGESVKRHLESFDVEASLNEMAEGAGRITDFSKVYRQRAHDNQRIGMTPQSMPRLEEVDEMVKQGEKIQISLQRMREVVYNHQQANLMEPPREAHYRPINSYDQDGQSSYQDDAKMNNGGFAGSDPKRQRRQGQRAAPPGRCHSCNRAETPEWRRGPDGARTLCNACGLHYAKLTRKMGGKQAMAGSNLRPKSLDERSPAA